MSNTVVAFPRANFSNMEIEVFFARYDHDGNFVYNPDDEDNILEPIEEEKHEWGNIRPWILIGNCMIIEDV